MPWVLTRLFVNTFISKSREESHYLESIQVPYLIRKYHSEKVTTTQEIIMHNKPIGGRKAARN